MGQEFARKKRQNEMAMLITSLNMKIEHVEFRYGVMRYWVKVEKIVQCVPNESYFKKVTPMQYKKISIYSSLF